MRPIRLLPIPLFLLLLPLPCLGDESEQEPSSVNSARSQLQPYVDWLPPESQTLVVSQRLHQIPEKLDEDVSFGTLPLDTLFLERHAMRMFEGDARGVLAGKRIKLWIEAASRFYFPEFPEEVEYVQTVGVPDHYDGCHVLVFDETTPPDTTKLFEKLLRQHPEPRSHIPAASTHRVEGHETIAFSASPPKRNPGEPPEDRKLTDAALSIRYWIAAPVENVLVVATSRDVLADTLRKVANPDQKAFPATLEEWKHITGDMPLWGMRHFPDEIDATTATGLAKQAAAGRISGFTFEIDAKVGKAGMTFLDCSPDLSCRLQLSVVRYISSQALSAEYTQETTVGTLLQPLDWSYVPSEEARKIEGSLASMLSMWIGHAVVI